MRPLPQNHTGAGGWGRGRVLFYRNKRLRELPETKVKGARVHLDHTSEYTDKEGEVQGHPGSG